MLRLCCLILATTLNAWSAEKIRLVSFSPGATQTLIDLGLSDNIVAATPWCPLPTSHSASRACDIFNPDIEELLKIKPDLCILPRLANPLWANRCQAVGLKVLILNPESAHAVPSDIRLIGQAVQKTAEAENLASYFERQPRLLQKKILIIWDGMMAGRDSYLGDPLARAAHASPLNQVTWQKLDWEIVVESNPDSILRIESRPQNTPIIQSEKYLEELRKIPAVKDLSCVKSGQVYETSSGSDWLPGSGLIHASEKVFGLYHK